MCVPTGDTSYVGNRTVNSNESMLYDLPSKHKIVNDTLFVNDELNTFDHSECMLLMLWAALGVIRVCLVIFIVLKIIKKRRRERII